MNTGAAGRGAYKAAQAIVLVDVAQLARDFAENDGMGSLVGTAACGSRVHPSCQASASRSAASYGRNRPTASIETSRKRTTCYGDVEEDLVKNYKAEYIWIDGAEPTSKLRFEQSFDGPATIQSETV